MKIRQYRWWHGVAFYAGIQLAQWALRTAARNLIEDASVQHETNRETYQSQRLPLFAPPGIAFPIAWSINCTSLVACGLHVLNLPADTLDPAQAQGRTRFLQLQAASWFLFALFDTAYFGLRSPINAAIVTAAYTGTTAASLHVALRQMRDPRTAILLATTLAWLALANPVAFAQAAWNPDPFWKTKAFATPPAGWEK